MIDTGDGLAAVTLATGKVGAGRVDIAGFCYVAVLAATTPIEFNALVGVC